MLDSLKDCIMMTLIAVYGIAIATIVVGLLAGVFAAILLGGVTLGAILLLVTAVLLGALGATALGAIILMGGCFLLFWARSASDSDTGTANADAASSDSETSSPCIVCTALRAGLFAGTMGVAGFIAARGDLFSFLTFP
jgi:hypothetical protein